jgi:NAD(P)H-hydrate repair Nnr-like enzyme with NAD(P)H-hydrate dehydratase domain
LLNLSTADIEQDRFGAVAAAVEQSRAVVLLKGARTLVGAPGRLPVVIPAGPPALATAGSGDVLSGITAALLVAIHDPFHAACAAAQVHGLSGDSWVETQGADRGLVAHEIADAVPAVLSRLLPKTPSAVRSLPD